MYCLLILNLLDTSEKYITYKIKINKYITLPNKAMIWGISFFPLQYFCNLRNIKYVIYNIYNIYNMQKT